MPKKFSLYKAAALIIFFVFLFGVKALSAELPDWRIPLQLGDGGCRGQSGPISYTPWFGQGGGWSWWAHDSNGYDPDCFSISLEQNSAKFLAKDFRLAIQMADSGCRGQFGAIRYTPWLSEGGGWTAWASDSNGYDPDCMRVAIESRDVPVISIPRDFRFAIQVSDSGCRGQRGAVRYTPWLSEGGGGSGWTSDANRYDPDCVRIALEARQAPPSLLTPTPAVPPTACANSSECSAGEICTSGICQPPQVSTPATPTSACTNSSECAAGLVCTSGICQPPSSTPTTPPPMPPIPPGAPATQCRDGIDNDDDDKKDHSSINPTNPDPGCSSADDNDERDPVFREI